jgi:hemerythrin-like metal-binding protein
MDIKAKKRILVDWSENYSVGISEIDEQHKKLVDIINDLFDAFLKQESQKIIGKIIEDLVEYTIYHFKSEEQFFEKHHYSGTEAHIAEHDAFTEQIRKFSEEFNAGKVTVSDEVMTYLKEWLIKHIIGSDKRYSYDFKRRGISFS